MNERDAYKRKRQFRQSDISTDTGAVYLHNENETPRHLVLKALVALKLQEAGREWGTEVDVGNGVVDVLDWGAPEGKAVAYEIETDFTPQRVREKVEQYTNWIIRDVIVIPAEDAPESIMACYAWLDNYVVG